MCPPDEQVFKQLGETLNSLAAYLLIAHEKHPKSIPNEVDDLIGNRSLTQFRITQHYVAALLAFGLPTKEQEFQRVARWFDLPLPQTNSIHIDHAEMTRLEGLLNINPYSQNVKPRLELLIRQRDESGRFVIPNSSTDNMIFNTLWALKVLVLAWKNSVLEDNLISQDKLIQTVEYALQRDLRDKDLALALRLHYELVEEIVPQHEALLEKLLHQAQNHGYLWGVADFQWAWARDLIQSMWDQRLSVSTVSEYRTFFRDVIIETCYVVENLGALPCRDDIQDAVTRSLQTWWQQFFGEDAPDSLKAFFPDEYDFLLILCRTIVSVHAYLGKPLGQQFWIQNLRRHSESFRQTSPWAEQESLVEALRRWINIEVDEAPTRLHLGLSGASVIRINPVITNPIDPNDTDLFGHTLIVKYGPKDDIANERAHYDQLPVALVNSFARVPKESYVNDDGQAFVIIEDLDQYKTFYELYPQVLRAGVPIGKKLGVFLLSMHRADTIEPPPSGENHLRDLYIIPMLEHVGRVFNHIESNNLLDDVDYQSVQKALVDRIALVLQYRRWIDNFPLAYSHGDLHSRNIMIRPLTAKQTALEHADFDFKLIDLESLRREGDAAYDAGQLLIDLDLMQERDAKSGRIDAQIAEMLGTLRIDLAETYLHFAQERNDKTFHIRVELGIARALLRVAKSHSKRSAADLDSRNYQRATEYARQSLQHAQRADLHLQNVGDGLRNLTTEDQVQPIELDPESR